MGTWTGVVIFRKPSTWSRKHTGTIVLYRNTSTKSLKIVKMVGIQTFNRSLQVLPSKGEWIELSSDMWSESKVRMPCCYGEREKGNWVNRKFRHFFLTLNPFHILQTSKNSLSSGPTCSQEIVVVALGRDLRYMSKILHIIYLSTWHLPCDDSTDFSHVLQYFVACVHSIPDPMVTSCVIIIPHYSRSSLCYIHRHQMLVGYMKVLVSNYRHRPTTRHTYSCSVHDIQD